MKVEVSRERKRDKRVEEEVLPSDPKLRKVSQSCQVKGERMALSMVAMVVASLVVGSAIASELSIATETRKDYTVHSHDKKVNFKIVFS